MDLNSTIRTTGVLRGEKSCFEIFGDTVNRMESTCSAGRIQISKSTADLLVSAGKSTCIKETKDGIKV